MAFSYVPDVSLEANRVRREEGALAWG